MIKKILALLLISSLISATSIPIFAQSQNINSSKNQVIEDTINRYSSTDIKNQIQNEISTLEKYGLDTSTLEDINIDEDSIEYILRVNENTTSSISINEVENGDIEFDIVEGYLKNKVLIDKNNDIYLDKNKVEFDVDPTPKDITNLDTKDRANWHTTTPPSGTTASDFNVFKYSSNIANVALKQMISTITSSAFNLIVGALVFANTGFVGALSFAISDTILNWAKITDPNSQSMSCKTNVYYHKNGNMVNGNFVQKENRTWYTKINYTGSSKAQIIYQYRAIW